MTTRLKTTALSTLLVGLLAATGVFVVVAWRFFRWE